MAVEPLDMRAGTEAALARVVTVFGAAWPICGGQQWACRSVRPETKSRAFSHGDGARRRLVYPPMPQSRYVQNDGSAFTRLNSAAGVKPVILRVWRIM